MRKLVVTQNITLDGSIEMLTTWFDPTEDAPDLIEESHRQDAAAEALLVGRQTFEDFRGYWPHQHDDPTGISDYLNAVHKYVVSSTMTDPGFINLRSSSTIRFGALAPGSKTAPMTRSASWICFRIA